MPELVLVGMNARAAHPVGSEVGALVLVGLNARGVGVGWSPFARARTGARAAPAAGGAGARTRIPRTFFNTLFPQNVCECE